jgi:hypothetical protein
MKFELTKTQIISLATNDHSFLSSLVDKVMAIKELPDARQMAEIYAIQHKDNAIAAIRALRTWADNNGQNLGLAPAKDLITEARTKFNIKNYWTQKS